MKKAILLLLFTVVSYGQKQPYVYFSFSTDVKNAIFGSEPTKNKPELNYIAQFTMVGNNYIEIGIGYEEFKTINYSRYFISCGYQFQITDKVKLIPSIEPSIINRWGNWGNGIDYNQKASFLSLSGSINLQHKLNDEFSIGLNFNSSLRPDTKAMYNTNNLVYSVFLKLNYEIKL
jgi:hypothetical protein